MAARPRVDIASVTRLTELADYIVPFAIRVACDLGVADRLAGGPQRVDDLAVATGAHAPALLRLLRALAGRGIFTEVEPSTFALTPLAEPLRADHPLSLRDAYPLLAADVRAWARLDRSVRTGEPAFPLAHGQDYWSYLADHPRDGTAVDRWMQSLNRLHLRTVAPACDWSGVDSVVDVGGGNGAFLAGLLARHRNMRGVLFDLPHVVRGAPEVIAEVADRCEVVAGSFFDAIPAGAGAYVLKTILPGFTDEQAALILRNVRAAAGTGGRVLLLEAIIPDGDTFDVAKLVDMHTLVLTGGRHRGRDELEKLLVDAGLRLVRVTPTPTLTVVEGAVI